MLTSTVRITTISAGFLLAMINSGCKLGDSAEPAAALSPYGASTSQIPPKSEQVAGTSGHITKTSRLPSIQRNQVEQQRFCPVSGAPLGSMGPPVPVTVGGRTLHVCCHACVEPLRQNPERYMRTKNERLPNGEGNNRTMEPSARSHGEFAAKRAEDLSPAMPHSAGGYFYASPNPGIFNSTPTGGASSPSGSSCCH